MTQQAIILVMWDSDTVGVVVGPFEGEATAHKFSDSNYSKLLDEGSFVVVKELKSPEEFLK